MCEILSFNTDSFPFKYLSIFISPKRLLISCFQPLLLGAANKVNFWSCQHISSEGKVILINNILMALHSYYLAVYPAP